jgi:HEAT repeat protein
MHKEKLMWKKGVYSMFNVLSPSEVRHVPHIPHYPALVDQMTRLELLNILSIAECEGAKELIKEFLHTQSWGVVGSAAVLVLEEGDMEAIDVVRELLEEPDEKIRIQAALALAFYGRDPSVVRVLESAYVKVDWEKKISILEALGFIGSRESIPFLMKVLEEPFQLLRTVAASSIIQCLYH